MWNLRVRNLGLVLAASVALGGSLLLPVAPASAQALLEQQGNLQPMEDEYTFSGQAGQTVVISMISPDFDTLLLLLDADDQEIAANDDYGRSLNSTIVMTLPQDGTYKVQARSFSGGGGNYSISVRPANAYDQAFDRAVKAMYDGDTDTALTAFDEAIRIDPNQANAYAGRGDLRLGQNGLSDQVIADYTRAATLYEQAGDLQTAQILRDQLQYLQNPPEVAEEMPMPEPTPQSMPLPR